MSSQSASSFDVLVIGSGPGGYVAAIRCAQLGLKTAVVERDRLGGICLNWGCIPTKALLESARLLDEMRRGGEFGLICDNPRPDWAQVVKRSRDAAQKMSAGVQYLLQKNRVEVLVGRGVLNGREAVRIDGDDGNSHTITARNIILATGAHARPMPGLKFDGRRIIDYHNAMILPEPPKRLLVVGAGAIGVEFSYFYSVMGSRVTLVELMPQILPLEDDEVAATLARSFAKRGIEMHTSSKVVSVKPSRRGEGDRFTIETPKGEIEVEADVCLVAAGVTGNVEQLGLEGVGVATERGFIKVDGHMRTSVPNICAIGDCVGAPLLAHAASHEGILAAETIAGLNVPPVDHSNVPACTYCHPQIASVGMTEAKAKEAGYKTKTGKYLFRVNGRAVAGGETDGFVKFVVDAKFGEVLGVHIIGPGAPELIGEVVLGREFELTARDFARTIHAHPTLSEAMMEAAGGAIGATIHL